MVEVQLLNETEDQIFIEVTLTRRDATFTAKLPKYKDITTESMIMRFRRQAMMELRRGMSVRMFESFINRTNNRTIYIKEQRDAGLMENHLGEVAVASE